MKLSYKIKPENEGKLLHQILTSNLNLSTRLLNKLLKNKKIELNKQITNTKHIVHSNDLLEIYFDLSEDNTNIVPTKMDFTILYEDDWFLVVEKPSGVPIHPSRLHYQDSLSNGIKYYFDQIGLPKKIRPVNRLDLDTSGLVIFAKCEYIQECFIQQMANQTFLKDYLCVVDGYLEEKKATISLPIGRKDGSIIERCIDKANGHIAITHYQVLKEFKNFSLVKCRLETGKTHQIRVHMSAIGHPILRRYFIWNFFLFYQ